MKLIKCPQCDNVIDIDDVEELDKDEVIGCGKKEDDFMSCYDCSNKDDPVNCKLVREKQGLTITLAGDIGESE